VKSLLEWAAAFPAGALNCLAAGIKNWPIHFGVWSHLLGIQPMSRIRNWKEQHLYLDREGGWRAVQNFWNPLICCTEILESEKRFCTHFLERVNALVIRNFREWSVVPGP
jgi:hypothetical protein